MKIDYIYYDAAALAWSTDNQYKLSFLGASFTDVAVMQFEPLSDGTSNMVVYSPTSDTYAIVVGIPTLGSTSFAMATM